MATSFTNMNANVVLDTQSKCMQYALFDSITKHTTNSSFSTPRTIKADEYDFGGLFFYDFRSMSTYITVFHLLSVYVLCETAWKEREKKA